MGPEHEFYLVDEKLKPLPITDKVIKDSHGRIVNFVEQSRFTFGKELQLHVMELKANESFTCLNNSKKRCRKASTCFRAF